MLRLQRLNRAGDADPRRVDEHVEAAEALAVLGDDADAVFFLAHVGRDGVGAELRGGCLDLLLRARGECQVVALVAQHGRDREPDPRRAARDECARHADDPKGLGLRRANRAAYVLSPEWRRPRAAAALYALGVKLTDLATAGGCAAKYSASRLEELLRGFVPAEAENLLVGLDPADDAAVFDGADRQVRAAGAILAGGHTIRDAEPKYGLAVVGTVALDGIWPKSGAQPGDALYLTKPLGTALVLGGAKRGLADPAEAVRWMRTLNRDAADLLRLFSPNAVTDVTGFGLLGHAHEMATRSGVRIVIDAARLPALAGALEAARAGVSTAGTRNNREYAPVAADGVAPELVELAYDPQTAGGLLVSLPRDKGPALEAEFARAGAFLARVGTVEAGSGVGLQ